MLILVLFMASCSIFKLQTPYGKSKMISSKDKSEAYLKEEYRQQIFPFNKDYIETNHTATSLRRFETIIPSQLQTLIDQYDKVFVTYWHKCPSSLESIQVAQHIADSLHAKLIIVSLDYELEVLNQHLDQVHYTETVYIAKNPPSYTFKLNKKLQFSKYIAPKTYHVLKDVIIGMSYFYFDRANPQNNFSTTCGRYQRAEYGYKKITPENALDVYYNPRFRK